MIKLFFRLREFVWDISLVENLESISRLKKYTSRIKLQLAFLVLPRVLSKLLFLFFHHLNPLICTYYSTLYELENCIT